MKKILSVAVCLMIFCLASFNSSADASSDKDVGYGMEQAYDIDQNCDVITECQQEMAIPESPTIVGENTITLPIEAPHSRWIVIQDPKPINLYKHRVYGLPLRC